MLNFSSFIKKNSAQNKLSTFLVVAFLIISLFLVSTFVTANSSAISYLESKSQSAWSAMALVSAGQSPDVSYLQSFTGSSAIEYAAPILALTAVGQNPSTYPDSDLVVALKSYYNNSQIGDVGLLNDDIFGALALVSASVPTTDTILTDAKSFILNNQNTDGGWAYTVGGTSDTNMTAAAIAALRSLGVPVTDAVLQSAKSYLQSAQNPDGGFPYDPVSPWGTNSDASSDAWVISAIYALGENPNTWTQDGNNPITHLESLQAGSGYFAYQLGSPEDGFSVNTTAYALIALSGKYLPITGGNSVENTEPVYSNPLVTYRIEGSGNTTLCSGSVRTSTPLSLVEEVATECDFTYNVDDTIYGPYLNKIGDDEAEGLLGWMYYVNNVSGNVGAGDYELEAGDHVLWYFGEFGDEIPSSASVVMDVNINDQGESGEEGNSDTIAFSLNVSNLDFGSLSAGGTGISSVGIENTGGVDITMEAIVGGNNLFKDYTLLDNSAWAGWQKDLNVGAVDEVEVKLPVPSSYNLSGVKSGTLVFWARESI